MKVILLIGRICCGKTTYARRVMAEEGAVLLSADELMQTMFPGGAEEMHDVYACRCRAYLYAQAVRLARQGATPVMDFGFWNRENRREAIEALEGLELDWRYLDVPEDIWQERIEKRNAAIGQGQGDPADYYVDEGLLKKCISLFEAPAAQELPGLRVMKG